MNVTAPSALKFEGVTKSFGANHALRPLDMQVSVGTIHAFVGENGAGKSTCLGIAAGRIPASSGAVRVFGNVLRPGQPRHARELGLAAIYQELSIVPALSAQANVFLGHPLARAGVLSESAMKVRFRELCAELDQNISTTVKAGELSIAQRQLVEIMRALALDAKLILFDEPTSSLGEQEREALLDTLRSLRAQGRTVVLVSHNLDEVLSIADEVTVFRDGVRVTTRGAGDWTKRELVAAMIGERRAMDIGAQAGNGRETGAGAPETTAEVLSASVTLPGRVENVHLRVRRGEILGVAGLVGSGRTSLLRCLAGLEPSARGDVEIQGRSSALPRSPRSALARGIAMIPEDRRLLGLVLDRSAADNIMLSSLGTARRWGLLRDRLLRREAARFGEQVGFRPERIRDSARRLSGGNQQKLLVARWCASKPMVLLADEPTRGIDIGARKEILDVIRGMARDGVAVILVSSELEEIVEMSDRVIVLAQGEHVATLTAGPELSVRAILHASFRVDEASRTA